MFLPLLGPLVFFCYDLNVPKIDHHSHTQQYSFIQNPLDLSRVMTTCFYLLQIFRTEKPKRNLGRKNTFCRFLRFNLYDFDENQHNSLLLFFLLYMILDKKFKFQIFLFLAPTNLKEYFRDNNTYCCAATTKLCLSKDNFVSNN